MIWTSHARKGSNTPVGIPESTFLMSPPSTSTSRTCSVWLPPTTRETPRHHNQPRCRSGLLMLAGSDREFDNFDIPFLYRVLVVITDWNPIFQLHYNITHCWYLKSPGKKEWEAGSLLSWWPRHKNSERWQSLGFQRWTSPRISLHGPDLDL